MLKPYIVTREYKVDDGEWNILNTWTLLFEEDGSDFHPKFLEETIFTFDELWESAHTFIGVYADHTFFRKRRVLYIKNARRIEPAKVLEGECNKVSFRDNREEAPDTTLAYLMQRLPSDIVIRYIKENGLSVCPLQ